MVHVGLHRQDIHYPTLHLSKKNIKNKKASYMLTHGIPFDLSSILFNCLKLGYDVCTKDQSYGTLQCT